MMSDVLAEYMNGLLSDYYICYFDILGYRAAFDKDSPEHTKFLATVKLASGIVGSAIKHSKTSVPIQCKTYSDNFLLYVKKELVDELLAVKIFIRIAREIQIRFLSDEGLIVRGGITVGEFYADDALVFGKGLIRAVELEEKYAQVPRIIIDEDNFAIDLSSFIEDGHLIRDFDGYCFVNYFDIGGLELIKGKCIRLINDNCRYQHNLKNPDKIAQTEKTISKYLWLLSRFNSQCARLGALDLMIEYEIKINERLCKTEIFAKHLRKQ